VYQGGYTVPVEVKPLFRPDALRSKLKLFELPARIDPLRDRLEHWARLFSTTRANKLKEKELLPDFFTDFFLGMLGYTRPVDDHDHHTFSREKYVESGGTYADAVIGCFQTCPSYRASSSTSSSAVASSAQVNSASTGVVGCCASGYRSSSPNNICSRGSSDPALRDLRQAGGTSKAPAARNSSSEIKCRFVTNRLQKLRLGWFHLDE